MPGSYLRRYQDREITGRVVSFGALLNSSDLAAACKAGRLCNDLGLDTISAGGTIAWAMEAYEKGHITPEENQGINLKWADMETVINTVLPSIAFKKGGLGKLLAQGSAAAAEKTGKGSIEYAVQSKGMEVPMHDPRGGGHGMALTYAMSPRGACHVADPMLFIEMGTCFWPEIGLEYELEPMTQENKPQSAAISVAMGAIENSACFCQFADRDFTVSDWLTLFKTVPGYDWDALNMMQAGRRIFYIKRLINHRSGRRAWDDRLSLRVVEPAKDGEPKGIEINMEEMREQFYGIMGMDPDKGIPTPETLKLHHMKEEPQQYEN